MTEQIAKMFHDIQTQAEDTKELIASLSEGLLVIEVETGRVHLMNKTCRQIFGVATEIELQYYWSGIHSIDFESAYTDALRKKQPHQSELSYNHKTYLLTINFYHQGRYAICVLQDISGFKQLHTMKKSFIDNVSHELRTPLTAINGFIETLEEESDPRRQHYYIGIIKKHTQRLTHIVSDLLLLSDVENSESHSEKTRLDLCDIVNSVRPIFTKRISEKSLTLSCSLPDSPAPIVGDGFQIEQVLINLLDNAIKYTDKGKITLEVLPGPEAVLLMISDTGQGIPPTSIDHIFERFYVVDKSRSREKGGTGLGLSIVKHILASHSADITVKSRVGEGTTFSIRFPAPG